MASSTSSISPRVGTPSRSRLALSKKVALRNSPLKPQPRAAAIGSKVRVVARLRPASQEEQDNACIRISASAENQTLVEIIDDLRNNKAESFKLDSCYRETDGTTTLFKAEVEPVLPLLFCGCDATVFAYGTPGSGKTYTIQGLQGNPGLTTLAMQQILMLASERNNKWSVEASYYEIYQDRCYDLLQPTGAKLPVAEDTRGRIQLRGLSQVPVKQLRDFEDVFEKSLGQRKVGDTGSSRSHTVVTITVTNIDEVNSSTYRLVGKLNLIDLAGNEDGGDNMLSVLSNVITAVSANERRIPYRDSKITRILQDSLTGTNSTVMIACLNPASFSEGCQTLSLGTRSKLIGEVHETPSKKVETEPKASGEKKKPLRSPLKLSSPVSKLFKSPSRFTPGQQRQAVKRVSASPACSPRKDVNIFSIYEEPPVMEESVSGETRDVSSDESTEASSDRSRLSDESTSPECPQQEVEEIDNYPVVCTPGQRSQSSPRDPPLSSMLRSLGTSLKEVATPGTLVRNLDLTLSQTPTTCDNNNINVGWTAVEKFTASSRNLRTSLLTDYLEILNTGTREDLLGLKGIGKRRAECIMELRENSDEPPFVQLRDLQKIGLSAKQAEKLFHGNLVRQVLELSYGRT